jgi:hypothetical protein
VCVVFSYAFSGKHIELCVAIALGGKVVGFENGPLPETYTHRRALPVGVSGLASQTGIIFRRNVHPYGL